jgi:tetratricopeptide (TPR) repeat protein
VLQQYRSSGLGELGKIAAYATLGPAGLLVGPTVASALTLFGESFGADAVLAKALANVCSSIFGNLSSDSAKTLISSLDSGGNHDLEFATASAIREALDAAQQGLGDEGRILLNRHDSWFDLWRERLNRGLIAREDTASLFHVDDHLSDPITLSRATTATWWPQFELVLLRWANEQKRFQDAPGTAFDTVPASLSNHLSSVLLDLVKQSLQQVLRQPSHSRGWIAWQQHFLTRIADSVKTSNVELCARLNDSAQRIDELQRFSERALIEIEPRIEALEGLLSQGFGEIKQLLLSSGNSGRTASEIVPREDTFRMPTVLTQHFVGRTQELDFLHKSWADGKHNVVGIVALGGYGKSRVVSRWLHEQRNRGFPGADRIFAWSFDSQGAGTNRSRPTSQGFFTSALTFFGDPRPDQGDDFARAQRLGKFVQEGRHIIVLDGLEPLQRPAGEPNAGRLDEDRPLLQFLSLLAMHNPGLCVITTRLRVPDFEGFSSDRVAQLDLGPLTAADGAALLVSLGVRGNAQQLEEAADEMGGHPLALTLLASCLEESYGSRIFRRDLIDSLQKESPDGSAAARIMRYYDRFLQGKPEAEILYLVGLFDRPTNWKTFRVVMRSLSGVRMHECPEFPFGYLQTSRMEARQINTILGRLRSCQLLAPVQYPDDPIDTHPLVREHFGQALRQFPSVWALANEELFRLFWADGPSSSEPSLSELEPIYRAVFHGARAGLHSEVWKVAYQQGLQRGCNYSTSRLGAFGNDLSVLRLFFEEPWTNIVPGFPEEHHSLLRQQTGYCLRAVGRLMEAAECFEYAHRSSLVSLDWARAANISLLLSQLFLTAGRLSKSVEHAKLAVDSATKNGSFQLTRFAMTTQGYMLTQSGLLVDAKVCFAQAATLLTTIGLPSDPIQAAYSTFHYADFLEASSLNEEAEELVTRELGVLQSLGRPGAAQASALLLACLSRLLIARGEEAGVIEDLLNRAEANLLTANRWDNMPLVLIPRLRLFRLRGRNDECWACLGQLSELVERGDLDLYAADCQLERCQLLIDENRYSEATQALSEARSLVHRTGYRRRLSLVKTLAEKLAGVIGDN